MRGDPLDHLDAAEAAADESHKMRDADLAQEGAVHLHRVADREAREGRAVGLAGGGVDGGGTGRALAAAEHVRADHAVAVRVDGLSGTDDGIPPAARGLLAWVASGNMRVAGERVADEDDVVVLGAFEPAALPRHVDALERAAVLEAKASGRQRQRNRAGLNNPNRLMFACFHGRIVYHKSAPGGEAVI